MSAVTEEVEETAKEAAEVGTEDVGKNADETKAAVDEVKKKIKPKAAIEGC